MAIRDINLVPSDILHRQRLLGHACFWAGCFIFSISVILAINFYQKRTIAGEQFTLLQLEKEHRQLNFKVEEIKNLEQELAKLTERHALLTNLVGNHSHVMLLMTLSRIMNDYTWLTELKAEEKKGDDDEDLSVVAVQLKGFSYSNEDLGNFIIQLSADRLFKGVVLDYAKEAASRRTKNGMAMPDSLIEFQIDCQV
jgi:Tfp pilus assembly protein PilN